MLAHFFASALRINILIAIWSSASE